MRYIGKLARFIPKCCGELKNPVSTSSGSGNAAVSAAKLIFPPRLKQQFVSGSCKTPIGPVPQISSSLAWRDHWGTIKARWEINRMNYAVDPGLYALGNPRDTSPVLVTANYKMSLDRLREALPGRDAWILVLDTDGINVWCAAGKGTFGTEELIERIQSSGLTRVISHRDLILPQLGAPGIAAHIVKKNTGFTVHYGPVLARDVEKYLDSGLKKTPEMRLKIFPLMERIVLIPVELVEALKAALFIIPVILLLGGLGIKGSYWTNVIQYGAFAAFAIMSAILAGTLLTPALLPLIPGRAFATKGIILGLITALVLVFYRNPDLALWSGWLETISWFFLLPAITGYLAMNFTGATTFTSLSGVKKEMRWALPLEIAGGVIGFVLWMGSRFVT